MNIENSYLVYTVFVGLLATLTMDIWAVVLQRTLKIALPNYCFVGRWLLTMPDGKFKHDNIAASEKKQAECKVGWLFHYVVGVAYAFVLVIPTSGGWLAHPTLLPALLLGIGTVVIPFVIMQPAFGLGLAASKAPKPGQARLRSLISHASYGVGLYLAAYSLKLLLLPTVNAL